MNFDFKSLLKEILRAVIACIAGAISGGCAFVPVFTKGFES